ncbi:MAG: DUF4625 domain-containing protein [Paludibacteraceae bacterium]|nr:DUF4625 domain-containing protein [Paludibacteraceae bacterium]
MGKNILFFVLSAIMCVSFSACDEEDADTTKPVITLDEPEDGDSLRIGESVHFECDFSDDEALGSYLIEIHNNFDGHGHKISSSQTRGEDTEAFYFKKSYDISNLRNTHVHHHDIVIPENATPGAYHLIVYCTDAAGNQAMVARDIILSHDAESHHHHDHDHDHEGEEHDHED